MTEFIGRLHPLLIHLPIGFLVLLGALEVLALSRRFQHVAAANRAILALTFPVAALSGMCGWLLSWSGGYDERILGWHKWLGVGVAGACLVLMILQWRSRVRAYRLCLLATLVLLVVTSHFGGSLTHGENYLGAPLKKWLRQEAAIPASDGLPASNIASQLVFASIIQPIFNETCVSCHGEKKSKGKLRLDTPENIARGGESGDAIVPNSAALSLIIKRIMLPPDDEDHMPPEGKRQPSADEIALLRWWIDAGASTDKTIAELNPPADIARLLKTAPTKSN